MIGGDASSIDLCAQRDASLGVKRPVSESDTDATGLIYGRRVAVSCCLEPMPCRRAPLPTDALERAQRSWTSDDDIADYEIEATSYGSSLAGTVDKSRRLKVTGHDRRRSPWALVKRIAEMLAEAEG